MKLHRFLPPALLTAALLAFSAQNALSAFRVIGYMPSWAGSVSSIQYSKLTHINYAFLLPNSNGSLQSIDNPSKLQSLVSTAHSNNVKVLISVGGWNDGDDSAFRSLASTSTGRTTFTNNIVNFVNQYGLDGVDIDWEYPDTSSESTNYTSLMTQLSDAMHTRGKLLTCAVVGDGSTGDGVQSTVFSKIDSLNIMAYDANSYQHSTYTYATQCLDYWVTSRGCPASKASLGVPFYSQPSDYGFNQLLTMGADPNADTWNGQGYNGIPTIKKKTNLCFDRAIGGIMMWELSQDATGSNSLLSAIDSVVKTRQSGGTTFNGNYKIIARHSGKAVVVQGASTADGANIFQWTYGGSNTNDEWTITELGGGYQKILNRNSGKAMVVEGAGLNNGDNVFQYTYGGSNTNDEWKIESLGGGYYRIINRNSGKVLNVSGAGTADGTNIDQWSWANVNQQQFQIISVP